MRASLLPCGLLGLCALACGTSPALPEPLVDCSAKPAGTFSIWKDPSGATVGDFETASPGVQFSHYGFDVHDSTMEPPGTPGTFSALVQPLDPPRCGTSKQALNLIASGFNDWGDTFPFLFGAFTGSGPSAIDETGYDGLAFWAKSDGANPSFTLTIADRQSSAGGTLCQEQNGDAGSDTLDPSTLPACAPDVTPDGTCWVALTKRCSAFEAVATVGRTWALYQIPFAQFAQPLNSANRGTPIDPSQLYILGFRFPKGAQTNLWVDDLGFYKSK